MLMQGIKRWLRSLFAWLPWNYADDREDMQATEPMSRGTSHEAMLLPAGDGPLPRPHAQPQNTITISIESPESPESPRDVEPAEWPFFENREHPITSTSSTPSAPSPFMNALPPLSPIPSQEDEESLPFSKLYEPQPPHILQDEHRVQEMPLSAETLEAFPPSTQQRLEFLRYLVQRGIVSDDIP